MLRGFVAVLASMASVSLAGQAPKAPPADTQGWIAEHRLTLTDAGGRYHGSGWDRMIADGRAAHFFMVGEQHASGTIARLETALHAGLAPHGYNYSGLEIGPASTRFVEATVRNGPGELARFLSRPNNGFAVPFLFFAEETVMAEQMVRLSKAPAPVLWGLDQEFVGSAPVVTEILRSIATTPKQKAALEAWATSSSKQPFLVGGGPQSEIDALAAAFAGNPVADELFSEIRASREIYRPFLTKDGGPIHPANLARETRMKRNFQRAFEAAEKRDGKPPKVFLKFGGTHAMRGFSTTDVPTLTNFLAEWGGSRGLGLVNIMIDCDGGTLLDPQSGKPGPCETYIGKDSAVMAAAKADAAPLQVYDFKAMRATLNRHKNLDPVTRRSILAFDYFVVVRDGSAATPVGQPATR